MKLSMIVLILLIIPVLPVLAAPPRIAELKIEKTVIDLQRAAAAETAWACLHSASENLTREKDPAVNPTDQILEILEKQGIPAGINPQAWAEEQLASVIGVNRAAKFRSHWKPLDYRVEPLTASQYFQAEQDAAPGVPAARPLAGYDPLIQRINRRTPHTMADPFQYIRHRVGGSLLSLLQAGKYPVEFHAGPPGLALRSLRSRGYGSIHRFTAPGTDDTTADGFFVAFRLTDGEPLIFHAGAFGTARLQRAQIFLHLSGIAANRVSRWLHHYPLERLFARLNPPPATAEDVACVGFSRGPVRRLLAREAARRTHRRLQQSGLTSRSALAAELGIGLSSLPAVSRVLESPSARILQDHQAYSDFTRLTAWLAEHHPGHRLTRMVRPAPLTLAADDLQSTFLRVHRMCYRDAAGKSGRLLLLGAVWGDLGREVGVRLADTGYPRVFFLGIAGGLRPQDRLGDLHRVQGLVSADGQRTAISRWFSGAPPHGFDHAVDINVCSPLVETRDWLEKARNQGATTVEMEVQYLQEGLKTAGGASRLESLLVISDLPGQEGQTLESRYHHKQAVQDGVEKALDVLLQELKIVSLTADTAPLAHAPRKIGMMTGTFDPIHSGHLAVARLAVKELNLDRLDLIPNPEPGHKDMASPYRVRNEMTAASIRHDPKLQLMASPQLRLAYVRGGTDAMIRQWRLENHGADAYYQIMGGDSFLKLAARPAIFRTAARRNIIAVVPREGAEEEAAIREAAATQPDGRVIILPRPAVRGLSSTLIRARLSRGEPVEGLVDSSLRGTVDRWKLYRKKQVPFTRRLLQGKFIH